MHFAEDQPLARDAFDAALPPAWPDDLGAQVRAQVRASGRKLVVLDDDPTGGQTVGARGSVTGIPPASRRNNQQARRCGQV